MPQGDGFLPELGGPEGGGVGWAGVVRKRSKEQKNQDKHSHDSHLGFLSELVLGLNQASRVILWAYLVLCPSLTFSRVNFLLL